MQLGIDDCTRMLFDHCGLGRFYAMNAPTFSDWTVEFWSTLDNDAEEERITFHLGGSAHGITYDELDTTLGITKPASSDEEWGEAQGQINFWCHSTRTITFDLKAGEYNYKWSHPCLRLAHKVIRMAWLGQPEINKVSHLDLEAVWSMTPQSTLVKNWRSLFLACCKTFQFDKAGKITIGGMISLLGEYIGIPFLDISQRLSFHFNYDIRQLR